MIDPRALPIYLAVCRGGTISAAARQLNISQPSVSVVITKLEEALGVVLFERSRSGIVLTPAGEVFRRRSEAMEVLMREAAIEVALAQDGVHGPLRVGGTPGVLVSLLPGALDVVTRAAPRFEMSVVERSDRQLVDMLRIGEIEIAFVATGIEAPPEDIAEQPLARDPIDLIAGPRNDHLPAEMTLADAARLRWILPEAPGAFRRQVEAIFTAAEVPMPPHALRCDSLPSTAAIIRNCDYVSLQPRRVVAAELATGVLRTIRILEIDASRAIGVRTLANKPLSALAEMLLKAIQDYP